MAQNLKYGTYYSSSKKSSGSPSWRWLVLGVIVAAVLGIGLYVFTLLSGNAKNDLILLTVRESSLLALANSSTVSTNIRDPDLGTANSNATILLASDVASLNANTGTKQLPSDLVKREADTNTDNLKQAALLDKFDSTYQKIVVQKVEALISEAQTLRAQLSSKTSRDTVDRAIVNLQSIDKQFTQLTGLQ